MKAQSKSQQQAAGAALSAKRGDTKPSDLQGASKEMYDTMTKAELEEMARENGWILIAFLDLTEAAAQPQLAARGYWSAAAFGEATLPVPAYPFVTSVAQPSQRGPAPCPGQDNERIYAALGKSPQQIEALHMAGVI